MKILDDYTVNKKLIISDKSSLYYDDFLGKDIAESIEMLEELCPKTVYNSQYFTGEYVDVYDDYGLSTERIYCLNLITERYETEDEFKERRKKEKQEEKDRKKRIKETQSQKDVERLRKLRDKQTEEIFKGVNVLTTEELIKLYDIVDKKLKYVGV